MKICLMTTSISGCSYFTSLGSDDSILDAKHSCEVSVKQHSVVGGQDDARVVESVNVTPDCTIEVHFEQTVKN